MVGNAAIFAVEFVLSLKTVRQKTQIFLKGLFNYFLRLVLPYQLTYSSWNLDWNL